MRVVVTLVHGTFGRLPWTDAGWTRAGSRLRRRLGEAWGSADHAAALDDGGKDVVFLPFRWSGMNWPGARYHAARRLRDHFAATAARYPDRGHYVIAHSHGGNVALYATRDAEREPAPAPDRPNPLPAGIVCLSTPFIAAQPRPVTVFRFAATFSVLLLAVFALVANLMGRVLAPTIARVDPSDTFLYALVLNEVWLEFGLCAVAAWYATNLLVTLARRRRDRITVDALRTPVRIYRAVGDEASAVLATSSFFAWLVTLGWSLASIITIAVAVAFAAPLLLPVGTLLAAERLAGGGFMRGVVAAAARSRRAWAVVVSAGTLLALASWGYLLAGTSFGAADRWYATTVAGLLLAVLAFSALSGLGHGFTAPFLEVTAEATPVGSWRVHLFAARAWGDGATGDRIAASAVATAASAASAPALAHSAAYADEGVLQAIAAWIADVESRRGSAAPTSHPENAHGALSATAPQ